MINNSYLATLYYRDVNDALLELLEDIYKRPRKLIDKLTEVSDLSLCSKDELEFLTISSSIVEYKLEELHSMKPPIWLLDTRLRFTEPHFFRERLLEGTKETLIENSPLAFKKRNFYVELSGLIRV